MKLFIIVLEVSKLTGIQFARTHCDNDVTLKDGYVEVSRRVFALKSKAHTYLAKLRKAYIANNLLIDPEYIHPNSAHSAIRRKAAKERMG